MPDEQCSRHGFFCMSSHLDNECKHKAVYPAKDNVQKCTVNINFYSRIPYMFCSDGNKCKLIPDHIGFCVSKLENVL